ncbi:MAG: 2-succinyl-5-enolpyruvyl-6-hydroxy-3-cyclohexene-1-carboxylic-acid synthase [Cyclobacteriaceae bacterium]
MLHPTVYNTSEVCHAHGINHVVLSPGSRNAPLIISFSRNEKIKKWVIPDERSAGFVALGIAQKLKQPVVLCCTSGTALLNYAPAIAEAYYREIPLIVISADRPPELIDQRDGQTIRQFDALKNHVKSTIQLPVIRTGEDARVYTKGLTEVILESSKLPLGPVHINIPFKEPFYPAEKQKLTFINENQIKPTYESFHDDAPLLDLKGKKVLILSGQQNYNEDLSNFFTSIQEFVPILHSPLSNLRIEGIAHADLFLKNQSELQPDILLTTGMSVLSKSVKNYIKHFKPIEHYHFDPAGIKVDTYSTNPNLVQCSIQSLNRQDFSNAAIQYLKDWETHEGNARDHIANWSFSVFSELSAVKAILGHLPGTTQLHLSNSTPVRYAELFGIGKQVEIWSNRGTSGIDGCTSTAVGNSLVDSAIHLLITGDLAFHYDRNAFFNNYDLPNLRVIVLNNLGGGIFRLIDGPSRLPELEEYFETRHDRTAKNICEENSIEYTLVDNMNDLKVTLDSFYDQSPKAKLLEIKTTPEINQKEFKAFKNGINEYDRH